MSKRDNIYQEGSIHEKTSKQVTGLLHFLKQKKIHSILDLGCGTGRHCEFFAQHGFATFGLDISEKAIEDAKRKSKFEITYKVGDFKKLPYITGSIDFLLGNHSLEYATWDDIVSTTKEISRVLKDKGIIFIRVASTQHPFNGVLPEQVYGFSHIGFCVKNGLPVHFFSEDELKNLFSSYKILRLEHITHEIDHKKISVPLSERILLGEKK